MKDVTKVLHECVPECSGCGLPINGRILYRNGEIYCEPCATKRGFNEKRRRTLGK